MRRLIIFIWSLTEKILHFIVFRLFGLKLTENAWTNLLQFVKFAVVGLSNTIISYVIYVIVLLLLQSRQLIPHIDYLIAQLGGFVLSVLWAFYWNSRYVFKSDTDQTPWYLALLKTYISYGFTGLFLNSILSAIWVELLHLPKLVAPLITLLISVPLNFIMNKFWAFRNHK